MSLDSSTHFVPIVSPPTPPLSPGTAFQSFSNPITLARREFAALSPSQRLEYLTAILGECTQHELLFISATVSPLLKRDFLRDLPTELVLHILSYIDHPRTLARASSVSRFWNKLLEDEYIWKRLCIVHGFQLAEGTPDRTLKRPPPHSIGSILPYKVPSYRVHFRNEYTTLLNWRTGGTLLRTHRVPLLPLNPNDDLPNGLFPPIAASTSSGIPTSIAIDTDWVVVGLANSRIHVFSARTGVLSRTLVGHTAGVWAVALIRGGGERLHDQDVARAGPSNADTPPDTTDGVHRHLPATLRHALGLDAPRKHQHPSSASEIFPVTIRPDPLEEMNEQCKLSEPSGTSEGWGQPNALVVSGGCDKELRVWDVKSGYCIYVLSGHQSTIRCLKLLHNRPIAVSGSRDRTLRVWDVQRGKMLRVLEGHEQSVRCLDVCGNKVVSGSYDATCRLWDVDTGECLHILQGHHHQIYSVAFDGKRIASGGLDTTVRIWDAKTGACLALLQGHTALVCQLQLTPTMLVTGGSDGRVITFSLTSSAVAKDDTGSPPYDIIQRLAAHDSSVTGLQLDDQFLVTGGNDGRVRLFQFDKETGECEYVRDLSEQSESVWKVAFDRTRSTCAILVKRAGKTVMEVWRFRDGT